MVKTMVLEWIVMKGHKP